MNELIRVSHGLWRPGDQVADLSGRAAALLSQAPVGTAVGGLAAARLHGLWLPSDAVDRIDLYLRCDTEVPERHSGTRRAEYRGRRRRVRPDEVQWLSGTLVTTPPRTWVDVAEVLSVADLVAAGDSVLRLGTTVEELEAVLARARHRRGVVRARAALPLLDGRSRSRPESHMRFALVNAGLPKPAVNRPFFDEHGQWLFEPDLGYEDAKLALEYNGALHADVTRMRRDITRGVDAGFRGSWRTETFGPAEVFGHPDQLAMYVRELRNERLRLPLR